MKCIYFARPSNHIHCDSQHKTWHRLELIEYKQSNFSMHRLQHVLRFHLFGFQEITKYMSVCVCVVVVVVPFIEIKCTRSRLPTARVLCPAIHPVCSACVFFSSFFLCVFSNHFYSILYPFASP